NERVEQVHVIRNQEAGLLWVEAWSHDGSHASAGKEHNAAAKRALQPVVFLRVENERQHHENRHREAKMQQADGPQQRASDSEPRTLHTYTSTAPGSMSMDLHSSVSISPSIRTSTGTDRLNST